MSSQTYDRRSGYPDDPTPLEIASPEDDAQISGKGADPTHHIKLIDGEGSSVGFVITDQAGDLDERTFRRFPSSDPQNPYVTEKQTSFGGGFGQAVFEDNRAKYWRSKGIDTTKDAIVLGPMFHYARGGYSMAQEYMPLDYHVSRWLKIQGAYRYLAQPFTPDQSWTETTYLKFWLIKRDTPPALHIKIWTDVSNKPGVLINNTIVTTSSITHTDGEWIRIAIPDTYSFGTNKYWITLGTPATASGHWAVYGHFGSGGLKSTDESSWTTGPEFYYRIEGNRYPATHNFFEYKKQLYWLSKYDAFSGSTLVMNGWRGVADTNAADKTDLYDSTQNWSGKITGDEVVQMFAGPASSEQEDRRNVVSGSGGNLVCDRDWEITHTNRDEYVVTNTDWCFAIAADSGMLGGRVSATAISQGSLYICRGNNRYVTMYETYRNHNGAFDDRWKNIDAKAQFVRAVNDPVAGDIVWFGHNRVVEGAYKPYCWYSTPYSYECGTIDFAHLGPNSGGGQSWVAAGGSQTSVTNTTNGVAKLQVIIGEVTGLSVNAQGEDYAVGNTLTLTGSGTGDAQVTVTAIGGSGEVTGISSIAEEGYDYDVATGQATATNGAGTGCTLDIDTVSSFSGDVAYLDLKDYNGDAVTIDLRNMTTIYTGFLYNTIRGEPNDLSAGDLRLKLSSQLALGNVISTVSLISISTGLPITFKTAMASLALTDTKGASTIASIGINVDSGAGIDRSFFISMQGEWLCTRGRSPVEVGLVDGDNITGLQAYGDPETVWAFTESSFGQIKNSRFMPVPMREIKTARHANNGIGNEVSDVYLLFTWKGRLQRYYRQNMEDLGPDFPQEMVDMAGDIVDVVTYPGRVYAAIDGGNDASSMILCHKGGAWHEVYTSFEGERIRKLYIQPIEGHPDKLWASVGGDVMWFPIILDSVELPANSGYMYRPTGHLDTSWIYTGDRDLNKVFRSLLATMDAATGKYLEMNVYYKVDDEDSDWVWVRDVEMMSYSTRKYKLVTSNSPEARGNRIKFRIVLRTRDCQKSHVVRSLLTRMYRLSEVKYIYSWLSKISSISINLRGDEERALGTQATAEAAMNKLDSWAENLTILTTDSDIAAVNQRQVVIEPVPFQLLMMVHDEAIQEESIQMSANEVD